MSLYNTGAVSEAFSTACTKGDDIKVSDFDSIFKSEDGFAFAAVRLNTPSSASRNHLVISKGAPEHGPEHLEFLLLCGNH